MPNVIRTIPYHVGTLCVVFAQGRFMDHLIPTLLGIVGALLPVALGYWIQQRAAKDEHDEHLPHVATLRATRRLTDDLIVRGGRVYL